MTTHDHEPAGFGANADQYNFDNKWFGVPAKGEQPLPRPFFIFSNRLVYIIFIIAVIIIEIGIWAVYRWLTAPLFAGFGTLEFYLFHIIAAPTIHLIPILVFWRLIRRERGHPFVFSKKLLMSGVIVGFIAAIIWRLLEEFIYDGLAGMAGGTVPGTFTFFNLLDIPILFVAMTFVHFFIVGPVEELEFRGFTQDQVARVSPNWIALIISSVLFGCSHIPIAVFVYQFTPVQFVVALIGWITAGAVFGALYMWSRNIFACIVMHGMGNWQLSVFYFASTELVGGMDATTTIVVGTITSVIANAIMILIFYLIHKFYWQPHRFGEPAFGGILIRLQDFIHDHDFERKPIWQTSIILVLFCVVICGMFMAAAAIGGETDYSKFYSTPGDASDGSGELGDFIESAESMTDSGTLTEGSSTSSRIVTTPDDQGRMRYIKEIRINLTWTDEPDIQRVRTYENTPDTFSVRITGMNETVSETGRNEHGSQGSISATLTLPDETLAWAVAEDDYAYGIDVEITLDDAGNFQTNTGPGVVGYEDTSNQYEYEITVVWLVEK